MLFVIEGPVAGSGYDWYLIAPATFGNGGDQGEFRYWGDSGPIGWVASTDQDGTPWIVGAKVDCPDAATPSEDLSAVERLGPLVALSCYGHAPIRFRAKLSSRTFVDGFGEGAGPDPFYPDTYWATPLSVQEAASFGTVLDRARFPNGDAEISRAGVWTLVGHFDDVAAPSCGTVGKPKSQSVAAAILVCRTTFVVTDLVIASASVACPANPSIADLARLGGADALTCYGGRVLQVRAFRQILCGDGMSEVESSTPEWLTRPFGPDALFDREAKWGDKTALGIYGRAHPSLVVSGSLGFSCDGGWFDVTGHFDDPASSDCRITISDPATGQSREEDPAQSILACRRTFVFTELRPVPGPK